MKVTRNKSIVILNKPTRKTTKWDIRINMYYIKWNLKNKVTEMCFEIALNKPTRKTSKKQQPKLNDEIGIKKKYWHKQVFT